MRRGHPDGERVQEARGLDRVFSPRAVAVVGASTDPNAIGHQVLRNILEGGYRGAVHPVNLRGDAVLGKDAFRSVLDVPGPVDLAVIVVPSAAVLGVAEDCAKKGVKGLVVISAGFREAGPEGAERERRLEGILRRSGMRMVGPNCLGIINSNPYIRLNAIFGVATHRFGPLAIMSQSGALALALLAHSADIHLGVARFASMGNKADVSGNDLLLLWEHDPDVKVIAMYIESFGNPRNFVRIARRISRTKPILVVKSGRSTGGARAASSHTGAMAEADRYVDALLDQCGVLRAATVEELFDEALALSLQPLPRGPRVGIITNSGGPAIMAADALDAAGLRLADLSAGSLDALSAILPPEATPGNPIDLLAGGGAAGYARAVEVLAKDPGVDAIVVICTPIMADDTGIAEALVRASRTVGAKPVLCVFFGRAAGSPGSTRLVDGGVPSYAFPESAVRSLGAMWRLSQYRSRPEGKVPPLSVDADRAARFLAPGRERPDGWLRQDDALELLAAYGFRVARFKMARSADEAAAFASPFRSCSRRRRRPSCTRRTWAASSSACAPRSRSATPSTRCRGRCGRQSTNSRPSS
ncbi:MAG: CoA-binding protein [Euryarchaeota archaeon]|nr:CoA-binding protein [Euryarchaeota archaeon]